MFCSCCGKTLKAEWKVCGHCNAAVGESKFDGFTPYTSTQPRLRPSVTLNADEMAENWNYTLATYTGGDYDEPEYDVAESGTAYRPVFEALPEEVHSGMTEYIRQMTEEQDQAEEGQEPAEGEYEEMPEEEAPAEDIPEEKAPEVTFTQIDLEQLENEIEGFDSSQLKSRPIVAKKFTGVSSGVEEYVRRLENGEVEEKRTSRRGRHMAEEDAFEPIEPENEAGEEEIIEDEDDIYDDEPRGSIVGKIVKIAVALVAVAALFVVGVYVAPKLIDKFRQEASAPIEGVTLELYNSGLELIKARNTQEYRNEVLTTFQNGGFMALTTRLDSDVAAFKAFIPETPSVNDQLFVDAVSALQGDIGNAITLDAVEISANGSVTSQESTDRWTTISEALTSFESINSAAGLSAVVSGERIIADLSTPTPTIAPQASLAPEYKTLAKKDEGEDVQKLQERLWELGYLEDDRDGKFGNNTQTAVKLFQQNAGLEVTGVADNETQVLLYSDEAPMTDKAKITPVPEVTPTPEPTLEPTAEPVEDATPVDAI